MPATAEPPAAPPAAASPPAAPSSQPAIAARTTINVSELPKEAAPVAPPKPGSARERMGKSLRAKFGGEAEAEAPPAPVTPPKTESPPRPKEAESAKHEAETDRVAGAEDAPAPAADAPAADTATATVDAKGKRVSPWKLVDQFKERATKAEARALELEKQVLPEEQRKAQSQELETLRSQVKAMADELRFHNAEQYDPDIKKADAEYQESWKRAMSELGEITLTDPETRQPRAVTSADLLELVNMPLGKAREVADAVFGNFADDVMAHRKEIRRLFEAKGAKLEELKKTGAERERQRAEQYQAQTKQLADFVKTTYEKAVSEALADEKHGHYFKPREGDKEWNDRIEAGFKLVDRAYSENAMDPRLTPEQRTERIRRHAAVRNRAASWGALRYQNERLTKQIEALEAELKSYKTSQPPAGGRTAPATKEAPRGMAGLRASLQEIAKPG